MSSRLLTFLLLSILGLYHHGAHAQYPRLGLEAGGSLLSYKGELGRYDRLGGGLDVGLRLGHHLQRWGYYARLSAGQVTGSTPGFSSFQPVEGVFPNRSVETRLLALQLGAEFTVWTHKGWEVYLSQGIGMLNFLPRDAQGRDLTLDLDSPDIPATRPKGETYRTTALLLPTGLGGRYLLANGYMLGAQLSLLNPLTDYLDNIGQVGDSKKDGLLSLRCSVIVPLRQERTRR